MAVYWPTSVGNGHLVNVDSGTEGVVCIKNDVRMYLCKVGHLASRKAT